MSQNVVPPAVNQGDPNVPEAVLGHHARCSRQYVLSVVRRLKYRSSHVKADQYIAVTAIAKSNQQIDKAFQFNKNKYIG